MNFTIYLALLAGIVLLLVGQITAALILFAAMVVLVLLKLREATTAEGEGT